MHYEEMLTWLLFYTSLLDLAKTPEQDVLDPGGLVKSQVVQSADGALRIVLNASQSRHALSTRFLWEAFGSGVQHIAFATDDIFADRRASARRTAWRCCRSPRTTTTTSRPRPICRPSASRR